MVNAPQFTTGDSKTFRALLTINRVPETLGYNLTYFAVGIGLAPSPPAVVLEQQGFSIGVLFAAIMLSKMQASIADALHDQALDADNPAKSYIATSLAYLGRETAFTFLVLNITLALVLWGWLTHTTGTLLYIGCGAIITLLGFLYSYPPRIKERGVLNHLTTTSVDVMGVILSLAVLSGATLSTELVITLTAVFAYTFAYHVMHQASDTFYDRQYGVSTFTQTIGVRWSVRLAAGLTLTAGLLVFLQLYVVASVVLLATAIGYWLLARRVDGLSEREQSDCVSRWFHIEWVAVLQNAAVAVSLLL